MPALATGFQPASYSRPIPWGLVPGGIDTFIRGLLRWAPDDIDMSLIGMTTDGTAWPVERWHVCNAGAHPFRFYPVLREVGAGVRTPIPLSLRFTLALKARRPLCEADVLEFHRLEPMLAFLFDGRPKNAFFHQDMAVLHDAASDIRWKHVPWLCFGLERLLIPRLSAAFAVREEAVRAYRARYPRLASSIEFIPTWMDPEIFRPADAGQRRALRDELLNELGFSASSLSAAGTRRRTRCASCGHFAPCSPRIVTLRSCSSVMACCGGELQASSQPWAGSPRRPVGSEATAPRGRLAASQRTVRPVFRL